MILKFGAFRPRNRLDHHDGYRDLAVLSDRAQRETTRGGKGMAKFSRVAYTAIAAVLAVPATALGADSSVAPDDGTGYHAGSFWYLQNYELGGFYDSNVYADPDDPTDGFGGYIQSNLTAKSDWGRHGVQFRLYGDYYQYFEPDDSDLNRADVLGEVRGYIDI